ncbi:MAG TPA: hypothetical protein VD768_00385 [Sphingomicrobium sp.]|nr:hypothetical protein [Sphingomicrobium sp.]
MRSSLIAALLIAGCGPTEPAGPPTAEIRVPRPETAAWDLQSSGEGVALALVSASGGSRVRLFCPADTNRLLVNVPAFRPIGSEERLSFGSGAQAAALVADPRGDGQRGGVSGIGPVPDNLPALIGGEVSVSYGAQSSGPHAAPPTELARAFVSACAVAPPAEPSPPATEAGAGACRMQDGKALPPNLLRAVGTEPFWGARIEGRCVTYSHPENQAGTRIWTQFRGTRDNGVWTGFYANQRFVLRTRPEAGCSDGMSDNRYPIAVSLTVAGEQRNGCAELL